MIKAIIFDLGGVIQGLDWSPIVNSLLDLKGDLSISEYKSAFYYDRKNNFDLYAVGKMSKDDFWGMVASKLGIGNKNIGRLSQTFELIYSFINNELLDLLKTLKPNYKIFALSNACPEIENKVIKDNRYVHLFDKFYFSHNMGLKKPNKEAYLKVTNENNLKPEECVFVDNDVSNIHGANDVGMKSILYSSIDLLKKELYGIISDNN
jgi:glucose-1-phosphatase